MNTQTLRMAPLLLAAALAAGAASAQVNFNVPSNLPVAKSTLTRAEVMADLLIWRAAGLQDLDTQGEPTAQSPNAAEHAQALARYHYMRASPQFAVLVSQLGRGETVHVRIASR
jgi:Domain of unknown function (DUF4148)